MTALVGRRSFLGGLGAGGAAAALSALPSAASAATITATTSATPSYAQSATNIFDPASSVYNWKAANTRRHRSGIAQAQAGCASSEIFIGDSLTAGCLNVYTGKFDREHAWPLIYRDTLARLGIPVNGTGIVRVLDYIYADPRISWTGPWTNNTTDACVTSAGATVTFVADQPGTAVGVLYARSAGGFTVSVDGAQSGPGFQTVAGGGSGWARVELTGLAGVDVGSKITITTTSSALVTLGGFEVYTANAGLSVHNLAQSGSGAALPAKKGWSTTTDLHQNLAIWSGKFGSLFLQTPSTVHLALGGNDLLNGATDATIIAALTTVRAAFLSSDCILYLEPRPASATTARWASFSAAMYGLADTLDVPLFDIQDRLGGYSTEATLSMNGDTFGHLSRAGYADWGRSVALVAAR
jgi:lysophospholipase L1-like esterase